MFLYIDDRPEQLDLDAALATVSPQRRAHALRYRQEHDQRLSLSAYQLLQRALRVDYGITEPPHFEYSDKGKPLIAGHPDIHFSLSHCREAAACVVDTSPVGIDIESLDSYDPELVPRTMNDDEHHLICSSPDPRLTFIRLWTMKESLLKMTVHGMTDDIRDILKNSHIKPTSFHTTVFPQFVLTVCQQVPTDLEPVCRHMA